MKKYFMSLAALMIALTATVLTSCSNEEFNEVVTPEVETPKPGTHVETLTIAFPDQNKTRVAMDGDHKLTGWELGDEVTLVKTEFIWGDMMGEFNLVGTYAFTCTNAANGTFTGTMPNGYTVNDCQLAFYNATGFDTDGDDYFYFSPKTRASQNMKDVVMLVAKNDGEGNFEMEIFGSILQVTNNTGADITASVKYSWFGYGSYYDYNEIAYGDPVFYDFRTSVDGNVNHQITLSKDAPTYVYIPVFDLTGGDEDFAVGLSAAGDAANECSIVPFKTNPGNAKLFKKTLTAPEELFNIAAIKDDIASNHSTLKTITFLANQTQPAGIATDYWKEGTDTEMTYYTSNTSFAGQDYDFDSFFALCVNLETINGLTTFNTSNATSLMQMFNECSSLTSLDLSSFNTREISNLESMFTGCTHIEEMRWGNNFIILNAEATIFFDLGRDVDKIDIYGSEECLESVLNCINYNAIDATIVCHYEY